MSIPNTVAYPASVTVTSPDRSNFTSSGYAACGPRLPSTAGRKFFRFVVTLQLVIRNQPSVRPDADAGRHNALNGRRAVSYLSTAILAGEFIFCRRRVGQ